MHVGGEPGPWGPTARGGRSWRVIKRLLAVVTVVALVGGVATATTAQLLIEQAETNLTRVPVPELEEPITVTDARHFLLVGSDARDGLSAEDRDALTLGAFEGQRSDTIIYVAISEDRSTVSLVSLPRDLLVLDDGRQRKLADTFAGGPDQLIRVIRENFDLPVNHYASVSLGGFIEVVRTLGGVDICLDAPLQDVKAGADFTEGCHRMDATEALAFVRSRAGSYGDYERIARQQTFLRAVLSELIDARVLTNPRKLYQLTEDVASNVTTDDQLGVSTMLGLVDEMRMVVSAGVPMSTVPSYPLTVDGVAYQVAYGPGAEAMFEDLREGRPLPDQGTRDDRVDTVVTLYTGGRSGGPEIVRSSLAFVGFEAGGAGPGPAALDAGATTTVYVVPGHEDQAGWVAATLGAPTQPVPADVTVPEGTHVLVGVGDDATGS